MSYKIESFKGRSICVMLITIVVFLAGSVGLAKSVYVVKHNVDSMIAYSIDDGQIEFQANLTLPKNGYGPIDVTLDPASDILLVSNEKDDYDGGNVMELVDARKLQRLRLLHNNKSARHSLRLSQALPSISSRSRSFWIGSTRSPTQWTRRHGLVLSPASKIC